MPLKFVKSERGKNLLIHDGILYSKKRVNKTNISWRCNSNLTCNVIIHTDCENKNGSIVGEIPVHNHPGNPVDIAAKIIKQKIIKKAAKSHEKTSDVLAHAIRGVFSPVAANLPKLISLSRSVQRVRSNYAIDTNNNNPSTRGDMILLDDWKYTHNGNLFLLHDNGGDKKRFIVFTTQKNLHFLTTCQQWLGDGTFYTTPAIFEQLYVIHGSKDGKTLPLVYLLAPNKSKTMYIQFLKLLRDSMPNSKPDRMMIDFEPSFIEAFKSVFSDVQINGCNFHFTQCVWRHVQTYGLQSKHNNDIKFSMNVRLLMALAFVPPQDVISAFEDIVSSDYYEQNSDLFDDLLSYFEGTWIGKLKHNKHKREKPLFPIKMWNCYTAVLHDFIRSNSPSKGWNSGFNARVNQAHPIMSKFMKSLKDEQQKTDVLITQMQSGLDVVGGRLKAYKNYTERLKRIAHNYDAADKLAYLNSIAKVLASKSFI